MVLLDDDCDLCSTAGHERRAHTILFSSLPFVATFLFVATAVFHRLYPLLVGDGIGKPVPFSRPRPSAGVLVRRASAVTFSTTIALSAVLAELILCEISDTVDPSARDLSLRFTVASLLILLVAVIPSLEIQSIIRAAGYRYTGQEAGRLRAAWVMHAVLSACWFVGFWFSGKMIIGDSKVGWVNTTMEHVGVIGISLMALLSGFASVSAPWQNFVAKPKPVSEASVSRKKAGLDSTNEMLAARKSRLRALEQKMSKAPAEGLLQKAMGTFRGSSDTNEKKSLEMEISGLENMATSLSSQHAMLHDRLVTQQLLKTPKGRMIRLSYQCFSAYCSYRIVATFVTFLRRRLSSDPRFVGSDPINNIFALLIKTYDPKLDRQVWIRQISFFLSGVMLCASFSSVLQTFYFFSHYLPGLLRAVQANLPLIIAQLCATYVVSVALLLRGIMPGELVTDRLKTLGGDDMQWVDGWFEVWFLGGVLVTAICVWISRKIGGLDDWDDDEDVEMGKIH